MRSHFYLLGMMALRLSPPLFFGLEASRIAPREFLTFFITDEDEAEEREISDAALKFDEDDPFIFRDRRARGQISFYAQDQFSPVRNLTVQAGLRYDHTNLPISDQQFSPRISGVYYFPKTKTALRASFNRLFQPPQVNNLLLSSSDLARSLSPFAGVNGGGADVHPEKISAYEAGFAQDFGGGVRLDAAYWGRDFRNVNDPNVFFNATVIFPNSVAKGFSRGVDVRLDVPEHKGWSGWLSYTNMRILYTGPINGGLFLTEEFIEIGPGAKFIPDQDQRNMGGFGVTYQHQRSGLLVSFTGRHESGMPLEVEEERLEELQSAPGAELVDFKRGRVKPRTIFNFSTGVTVFKSERIVCNDRITKRRSMRNSRLTHIFFLGAMLTTYAIATGVGESLNTSESGIEGQVSIGPMCPVERPDRPCPDKPFAASIEIQNQDDQGHRLTVRSGEDGRFRVKLAPGKYKLTPMEPNPGAPPHAPLPQAVTVESGKYAHVTIKYDSGIR